MTTAYGVTSAGFVPKPQAAFLSDLKSAVLGAIASDLVLEPEEPLTQLLNIFAEKCAELHELAEVAYNGLSRGNAEDVQLDNIGALTGTSREEQSPSVVYCQLRFTAPGTYAVGALVAFIPGDPSIQFTNENAVVVPTTNPDTSTVSPAHPYTTTAPIPFESTEDGPGAGNALIAANAQASISPSPATPGVLTGLVPVNGWLAVADIGAPTLGTLVETDPAYRARQVLELSAPGACTLEAVQASILEALATAPFPVPNATVTMYENATLTTDTNGLPGKAFQAVVFDGLTPNTAQNDPLIAQAIWKNKPAGQQSVGANTVAIQDSQGVGRLVSFSRSTQVTVYVSITVAYSGAIPGDIQAEVAQAILDVSQGQPYSTRAGTVAPTSDEPAVLVPGGDVIVSAFQAIAQQQSGVRRVQSITVGLAPNPTGTADLRFSPTQIAVLAQPIVTAIPFVP